MQIITVKYMQVSQHIFSKIVATGVQIWGVQAWMSTIMS